MKTCWLVSLTTLLVAALLVWAVATERLSPPPIPITPVPTAYPQPIRTATPGVVTPYP